MSATSGELDVLDLRRTVLGWGFGTKLLTCYPVPKVCHLFNKKRCPLNIHFADYAFSVTRSAPKSYLLVRCYHLYACVLNSL